MFTFASWFVLFGLVFCLSVLGLLYFGLISTFVMMLVVWLI